MPLKCVLFYDQCHQKFNSASNFKPGFHIVVSVVSVVRKKFIGQIEFPGGGLLYGTDGDARRKF